MISTSFGCPYEGEVPPERVFEIAERLAAAGCEEIAFGDTTGMANPVQVREFFAAARERLGDAELTAHFHNTRGQGLANVLAALEAGIDSFESSFGELGGCPVPPGATGNISTEDLVSMLEEMGVDDRRRAAEADRGLGRGPEGARAPARRPRAGRRASRLAPRALDSRRVKSDAFKRAAEAKDFSAVDDLFVDEPVFRSPAVFKPYEGRDAMRAVLGAVVQVFEDFRYTDQVESGDTAVLIFEARVGDRELNGVDILRFDADGKIRELMVMIRPLSALNAVVEGMATKLGIPTTQLRREETWRSTRLECSAAV